MFNANGKSGTGVRVGCFGHCSSAAWIAALVAAFLWSPPATQTAKAAVLAALQKNQNRRQVLPNLFHFHGNHLTS
jgi:hypothetical protein